MAGLYTLRAFDVVSMFQQQWRRKLLRVGCKENGRDVTRQAFVIIVGIKGPLLLVIGTARPPVRRFDSYIVHWIEGHPPIVTLPGSGCNPVPLS